MTKKESYLKAYEDFADAIFRHCYFRMSDKEKAKDLMQETFIKVWEYTIVNNNTVYNMRAFLYKTANNLIIDEYRKKKSLSLETLREDGFEPVSTDHENMELAISTKEVLKFIGELDPKYREVVVMRYVDDLSPKEIAEITGENKNNISVRINRGVQKLKALINSNEKK